MELTLTAECWIKFWHSLQRCYVPIITTDYFIALLIDRYSDWLLPLLRQFPLIPNRYYKFMDLIANCYTPCLTQLCWDLISFWWFVTFLAFQQSTQPKWHLAQALVVFWIPIWIFCNKICFYGEELLAPRPTPKLRDHPLSTVHDCLFNIFTATLHIGGCSSIRNLRMCHAMVTGHEHTSSQNSLLLGTVFSTLVIIQNTECFNWMLILTSDPFRNGKVSPITCVEECYCGGLV